MLISVQHKIRYPTVVSMYHNGLNEKKAYNQHIFLCNDDIFDLFNEFERAFQCNDLFEFNLTVKYFNV